MGEIAGLLDALEVEAIRSVASQSQPDKGGRVKTLAILALLSSTAFAQLPETPQPHSNKLFWSEVAAYTAANALDGYTTVRDTHWGYIETGSPYLYGRHPGAVRYSLVSGGAEVFQALVARKFQHSQHRLIRLAAHIQMDYAAEQHLAHVCHDSV